MKHISYGWVGSGEEGGAEDGGNLIKRFTILDQRLNTRMTKCAAV